MSVIDNLKKNAGNAFVAVGAGAGGAFAGRMIAETVGAPESGPIDDKKWAAAKKRHNIARGVLVAFGIAGFAAVKGDTTLGVAIKSAALGNAIVSALDLASNLLEKKANELPNDTAGRALRAGLGLGCSCNSGTVENRHYPTLAQPISDPMEGLTMDERIAYRNAMLAKNNVNPLLQVNDNAWLAIAS